MLPQNLKKQLLQFSEYKQQALIEQLSRLKIDPQHRHQLNEQFFQTINCSFFDIAQNSTIHDICSLVRLVIFSTSNPCFNHNTLFSILENVIQCICDKDFIVFIQFFILNFPHIREVEGNDVYKMLKVLNSALRRVPYQLSIIRGQIHCLTIKILGFGHESAFQLKQQEKPKVMQKCITEEEFQMCFKNKEFAYQFYHNYWNLSKCLNSMQQDQIIETFLQSSTNQSRSNVVTILIFYVRNIHIHVTRILEYFRHKEVDWENSYTIEQFNIDLTPIPQFLIKYAKRQSFRAILLIQVLIYCEGLKQKLNIFSLSNNEVCKIIKQTEDLAKRYLHVKNKISKSSKLMKTLDIFFANQNKWIQFKKNIKQFKKKSPFYKIKGIKDSSISSQDNLNGNQQNLQVQLFATPSERSYNVKYHQKRLKQEICSKLMITTENMSSFLSRNITPQIKRCPTQTSFSYYFDQGIKCMESFDIRNQCQIYFEESTDYNLFEWKAMRRLSRQNISQFMSQPLMFQHFKNYKLLHFVKKNADQFGYLPKKIMKVIQSQTDED